MAITVLYTQTALSVSGTELSVVSGTSSLQADTTDGVYQMWLDPVASMVKTNILQIRIYEKVRASGTQRVVMQDTLLGVQSQAWCSPALVLMHGWDFTLKMISGSTITFDCQVRQLS